MVRKTIGRSWYAFRRILTSAWADAGGGKSGLPPRRSIAVLLSLLVSFLLWFTVSMRGSYPLVVDLPTRVVDVPEGRSLAEMPPDSVRVQLHGEGWQLLRLYTNRNPIPIVAVEGETDLVEQVKMEMPLDLEVQAVSPATCDIQLGDRRWNRIPIEFRGRIEPAVTHDTTEAILLQPDSVTVSGSWNVLRTLRSWPTEFVTATNVRSPISREVALLDTLGGLVEIDTRVTTLNVAIEQFTEVVREVDVRIIGLPVENQGVSLDPDNVTATLRVPLSQVTEATESPDIYATVSFDEIVSDASGGVEPALHLPPGLANRQYRLHPPRLGYYLVVN